MNLKKSVKRMIKLLDSPQEFKSIHLTKEDYEKEKKHIKIVKSVFGGEVEMLYNIPVMCRPELEESMFLVGFPHSIINDDGTMKFYSYVNHYVKADLSYMDDMKI